MHALRYRLAAVTTLPAVSILATVGVLAPALVIAPAHAQTPDEGQRLVASPQAEPRRDHDGLALDELMRAFGVPGMSMAVVKDYRIHWARAYGTADVVTGAPVDTETLFQAASISKPVAAMAQLRAVQDGRFGLDQDINEILTSWTLDGAGFTTERAVTPRMLLSHTSGLGDGFGFPGYHPGAPRPTTVQILNGESPSNVGRVFMERPPMAAMKYSGGGVTVMELALTDVLGRPFDEIVEQTVLEPLGMSRSTYRQPLPPEWERNAARAHDGEGRARDAKWHVYPEREAAGLWTTPTDLARFVIEVQKSLKGASNRVLDRATQREMITPVGVGGYAVGFELSRMGEGWYFRHGGSNWGFRAVVIGHVDKGYGLAVMTNGDRGGALIQEVLSRVERAYGWDSLDEPVPR